MPRLPASTWLLGAAALVAPLAGACYEAPKPACQFLCGEGGACPDGYQCSAEDNRCHRVEPGGGLAECPDDLPIDAAPPVDSDVDAAEIDAMIDAAMIDAPMIDAPMIDAAMIDAPMIDAAMIDAMVDAAPEPDAMIDAMVDAFVCPAELTPTSDGSTTQQLVISEINPGQYIEVYNNSGASLDLENTVYQLCSPFNYEAIGGASGLGAGIVMPAGSYAQLAWPSGFTDVDAGGEVILYANSSFADSNAIMDFVCWGTNPHGTRKSQAESVNKWTGACAGAITGGAIHRLASTDGVDAADYDVAAAPSPATCDPVP